MKIELGLPGLTSFETGRTTSGSRSRTSERPGELADDEATLSASQAELKLLMQRASQGPEIRADRVEALRKQLATGTYKVDAGCVADAMMRDFAMGIVRG